MGWGEFGFPAGTSRSCSQEQDAEMGLRRLLLAEHTRALRQVLEPCWSLELSESPEPALSLPRPSEAAALSQSSSLPFHTDFLGTPAWPSQQTPAGAWLPPRPAGFGPKTISLWFLRSCFPPGWGFEDRSLVLRTNWRFHLRSRSIPRDPLQHTAIMWRKLGEGEQE